MLGRRGPYLAFAALLLSLLLGVMLLWREEAEPRARIVKFVPTAAPGTLAAKPLQSTYPSPPTRPPGPDEIEVCGLGVVKGHSDELSLKSLDLPVSAGQVIQQLGTSLAQNSDVQTRGAGLYLLAEGARWIPDGSAPQNQLPECTNKQGVASGPGWDSTECATATTLNRERWQAFDRAALEPVTQLVRLAEEHQSATLLMLAFNACSTHEQWPVCQHPLMEQWARVEPRNAVPWLYLMEKARLRKDTSAMAEALYQISIATSAKYYYGYATQWITPERSTDQWQVADSLRAMTAIYFEGGYQFPSYSTLMQMCTRDALVNANRRQTCDAVARVLANESDNILSTRIGLAIGQRVGWPEAQVEKSRMELAALAMAAMRRFPSVGREIMGCKNMEGYQDFLLTMSQFGELQAIRHSALQSGQTLDQIVNDYRREHPAPSVPGTTQH